MSTLHTIKHSWHDQTWLYEQLAFASAGDSILLLEDGVLCIDGGVTLASFVAKCKANEIDVFALQEDALARGTAEPIDGINLVDVSGFVTLVGKHDKHIAW